MSDLFLGVTSIPSSGTKVPTKLVHLIYLDVGKAKEPKYFISINKPELLNGFVQAKGIFATTSEEDIILNYLELLTNTDKELYLEMMFPWHKIHSIRSLVFRAK